MKIFFLLLLVTSQSFGVQLDDANEVELYINMLILKFEEKPQDSKFSSIIYPPLPCSMSNGASKSKFFYPKVLIWSPQEHFGIELKCPVHDKALRPYKWTNDVAGSKENSARLIYDMQGNIILVQRIYLCVNGRICHKLRSTSPDVQKCLPCTIQAYFPLEVFQRSGCTKNLIQYIQTQVLQGVNFLKISEGFASLNLQEFCRKRHIYLTSAKENNVAVDDFSCAEFYSNPLFAFPSNDQIMNLFLDAFRRKKHLYESDMNSVSATGMSCDHTFKVSRNIGLVRDGDNKFVTQFNQLFVALNERGEVLAWKLTVSTAFSEIENVLEDMKKRLEDCGTKLEMICVDDCCHVRNKYNSIFPDIPVKLDLFHACQRIVRKVPIVNPLYHDMIRDFIQIFRQDDDQGEMRLKSTPDKEKLELNLNSFIERWISIPSSPLTGSTMAEITNLRQHIVKGCLSGIPPGYGTERNEQLHRLLNRSLINGATRISTELAIALLTILFYYHSKKASACYHSSNKRIKPVFPVDAFIEETRRPTPHTTPVKVNPDLQPATHTEEQVLVVTDNIVDVCTETIAGTIVIHAFNLKEIIENTDKQSCNRSFNAFDMIYLSKISDILSTEENNEDEDPTINYHTTNLK